MDPAAIVPKDDVFKIFKWIKQQPGNKNCIDCNAANPSWASIPFGALICFTCAGRHRGLGTHITFVRSTEIDDWTNKQLMVMVRGGNASAQNYFRQHGLASSSDKLGRYSHRAGVKYRTKMGQIADSELRQRNDFIPETHKGADDKGADEDFFQTASERSGSSQGFSDASSGSLTPPATLTRPISANGARPAAADALVAANVSLAGAASAGTGTSDFGFGDKRKPKKKGGLGTRVDENAFSSVEQNIAAQRENERVETEQRLTQRGREDTQREKEEIFNRAQPTTPSQKGGDRAPPKSDDPLANAFGGLGIGQSGPSVGHSASASIQMLSAQDQPPQRGGRSARGGYNSYDDYLDRENHDRYGPRDDDNRSDRYGERNQDGWGAPSLKNKYDSRSNSGSRDGGWGSSDKSAAYDGSGAKPRADDGWGATSKSESDGWGSKLTKSKEQPQDDGWGAPSVRPADDYGWGGADTKKKADNADSWGAPEASSNKPEADGWGSSGGDGWGSAGGNSAAKKSDSDGGWGAGSGGDDVGWGSSSKKKDKLGDDNGGWGSRSANTSASSNRNEAGDSWGTKKSTTSSSGGGGWGQSSSSSSSAGKFNNERYNDNSRSTSKASSGGNEDRLKKYANSKSLSSDQYFDRDPPPRRQKDSGEETAEALRQAASNFGSNLKKFYFEMQDKYGGDGF